MKKNVKKKYMKMKNMKKRCEGGEEYNLTDNYYYFTKTTENGIEWKLC